MPFSPHFLSHVKFMMGQASAKRQTKKKFPIVFCEK